MKIPSHLIDYAKDITQRRIDINKDRYSGTHKQRTGYINSKLLGYVSREYYTEYIGILAELIMRHRLDVDERCSWYKVSTFIKKTEYVSNDCDIELSWKGEDYKMSVKGCENSMKANKQAIDSEDSDIVVFVVFTGEDEFITNMYNPEEIKDWEVKSSFSDYYYKQL